MAEKTSPYLVRKDIDFEDLVRVCQSKVFIKEGQVVLFDDEGNDSGGRHKGLFVFRELVNLLGNPLGYERVLDQKVVRRPGHKPNDKFTTTGTDTNGFTPIGEEWAQGIGSIEKKIIVCAGLAEGYRLHQALGLPVACVVGEQSIPKVIAMLRMFSRSSDQFIAAVDNDKAGYMAALRSGVPYLMPTTEKDFSDLYQNKGGVKAIWHETQVLNQPLSDEEREAELDRLMNRDTHNSYKPNFEDIDDRLRRIALDQRDAGKAPPGEPTRLLLMETEAAELGVAGMIIVNHEDTGLITGYSQFVKFSERLGNEPFIQDGHDQWVVSNAESMALLVAMMDSGLEKALDEIPAPYKQLKGAIFAAVKEGILDREDLPGGAPAIITLESNDAGAYLSLASGYDPQIVSMCHHAGGHFEGAAESWSFPIKSLDDFAITVGKLCDNPLRRAVFFLPDSDRWIIGTPSRSHEIVQALLPGLAPSFATASMESAAVDDREFDGLEDLAEQFAAQDDYNRLFDGGADISEQFAVYGPSDSHHDQEATAEEQLTAPEEEEDESWTVATAHLVEESDGRYLFLRSPYNNSVVSACRHVKYTLDKAFPDHPHSQFNKDNCGAWHFPVFSQASLLHAVKLFCHQNRDEIGFATSAGKAPAIAENLDRLTLQLLREYQSPRLQAPKGSGLLPADLTSAEHAELRRITGVQSDDQGAKKQADDISSRESRSSKAAPEVKEVEEPAPAPVSNKVDPASVPAQVALAGKGRHSSLMLRSPYRKEIVSVCQHLKNHLDTNFPHQPKSVFKKSENAWHFTVPNKATLKVATALLCQQSFGNIAVKVGDLHALASLNNQGAIYEALSEAFVAEPAADLDKARKGAQKEAKPNAVNEGEARYAASNTPRPSVKAQVRALVTYNEVDNACFFKLKMPQNDPEIAKVCQLAFGEFKKRERTWVFPVKSTREVQEVLLDLCSNDTGRIDVSMPDTHELLMACPENGHKIISAFTAMRSRRNTVDRVHSLDPGYVAPSAPLR